MFVQLAHDPFYFHQFFHQVGLGMQPAGRVCNQDVNVARPGRLQGVIDDRGRVSALLLGNDHHIVTFAPGLQLFDSRGTEGVTGGQHDLQALLLETVGEFTDGRGLAGTVDADHQHDVRTAALRNFQWLAAGREDRLHVVSQGGHQRIGIAELLAGDLIGQAVNDLARGLDAHIGHQQPGFDFFQQFIINRLAAQHQVGEPVGQAVTGARQAFPEPFEQARPFSFVFSGRCFVFSET